MKNHILPSGREDCVLDWSGSWLNLGLEWTLMNFNLECNMNLAVACTWIERLLAKTESLKELCSKLQTWISNKKETILTCNWSASQANHYSTGLLHSYCQGRKPRILKLSKTRKDDSTSLALPYLVPRIRPLPRSTLKRSPRNPARSDDFEVAGGSLLQVCFNYFRTDLGLWTDRRFPI